MTFKSIATSYIQWLWCEWGRLSAVLVTAGVIGSLTVGMARATRRYDELAGRVQAAFRLQEARRPPRGAPDRDDFDRRQRAELIRKLDELLARLPADPQPPRPAGGPLISSQ